MNVIPFVAIICGLLVLALVVLAIVATTSRVVSVVRKPDAITVVNLDASMEELIQDIRDRGYLLYLNSTCNGSDAKYSALFLPCDACSQDILPQGWDGTHHGDTVEEAVRKAASALRDELEVAG